MLLSVEDRPPKELLDELSALAAAKELSVDSGRERALAWRLVRQPDDWDAMVDDVCARLENVSRWPNQCMMQAQPSAALQPTVTSKAAKLVHVTLHLHRPVLGWLLVH